MNDPIKIVPTRPDKEVAEELKTECAAALEQHVIPILERAGKSGFVISFNIGPTPTGKQIIQALGVTKTY